MRVDGLLCFVNIHIGWTLAELCCEWTWRTASLYLYVDELSDIVITMRTFHVMVVIVILFALNVCSQSVVAQPTQASYAVNLTYVSVLLTYPSEVLPGDSVTVSLQARAINTASLVTLNAVIYYADGVNIHRLASTTLTNNNYTGGGGTLSKQIQFTIPQDAPRTSLIAVLAENIQLAYYGNNYYPNFYYYNRSNTTPYCSYYPNYYYGYGIASCPSYLYNASTDSGVAPLSYIKAATPDYQVVQQQLSQSQAENQQLKQDLQSTIAQKNSVIADLNQQLSSAQSTIGTLEFVTAVLAGIAIVLGIFTIYRLRGKVIKQTDETENKP